MNGIVQDDPGINKWWCMTRPTVLYSPVPRLSEDRLSALNEEETWLKRNHHFQSEILWLLSLEHHRFWSQTVYNPGTMDGLISFLQEALPYYVLPEFLVNPRFEESYHETAKLVFQVFVRLGTFDSQFQHYFPDVRQAQLMYDHHIFTLPIMLDLCHLYGRENRSTIAKVLETLFSKQPRYLSDIPEVAAFLGEVLKMLTYSFCGAVAMNSNSGEPTPLSWSTDSMLLSDMSPHQCHDKMLYVLDTVATAAAFLDIYTPSCSHFRSRHFDNRLAVFYNEAVPRIEKKIESIGAIEDQVTLYVELKHKLTLAKMEMLRLFKAISNSYFQVLLDLRESMSEEEVKTVVDDYLTMLTDCLAEHTFIRDYHSVYGVDVDLDTIAQISPELDTIKYNYVMESVMAAYPLARNKKGMESSYFNQKPLLSKPKEDMCQMSEPSTSGLNLNSTKTVRPIGVELDSLISEVRDILPDLGNGFVLKCLEQFDYRSDAVINAILEDSLPSNIKNLDRSLPVIPDDKVDDSIPKRLNVFDNDEFDIMTRDHIDTSKVHKGKRRTVPKNAFDLLNDKSELKDLKEMYHRFGSIDTAGSLYDDEYDDTYDDDVAINEAGEVEQRRHFVVPRVLRSKERDNEEEEESEEEEETGEAPPRDAFCENPAEVRARRERQRAERMQQRGTGGGKKLPDVVGKPKGQGQEKEVTVNRDRKKTTKSSRANHNRRTGAQHKRNQGMFPS